MDFKRNQKVKFTTQRGNRGTGVIKAIETPGGNGKFFHVARDGAEKSAPPVRLRASQMQAT